MTLLQKILANPEARKQLRVWLGKKCDVTLVTGRMGFANDDKVECFRIRKAA
jgi:hypothetical protein